MLRTLLGSPGQRFEASKEKGDMANASRGARACPFWWQFLEKPSAGASCSEAAHVSIEKLSRVTERLCQRSCGGLQAQQQHSKSCYIFVPSEPSARLSRSLPMLSQFICSGSVSVRKAGMSQNPVQSARCVVHRTCTCRGLAGAHLSTADIAGM